MYEFFQTLGSWAVTAFVLSSMLNEGMTQKPTLLWYHLSKNHAFLRRMLLLNFVVVPALMIAAVRVFSLDPVYEIGLLLFGLCAGAAFLIKLADISDSDMALAATVLLVLMVGNVIFLPIMLPIVLEGVAVDIWLVTQNLLTQMILPLAIGMLLMQFFERFVAVVQPWVARFSNISLYVLIVAIVIGYLPNWQTQKYGKRSWPAPSSCCSRCSWGGPWAMVAGNSRTLAHWVRLNVAPPRP